MEKRVSPQITCKIIPEQSLPAVQERIDRLNQSDLDMAGMAHVYRELRDLAIKYDVAIMFSRSGPRTSPGRSIVRQN